ncbi:hypothetical protein C2G38_2240742 [Gigaspora rosea]|uniref:Uncharacterized protein n=1 Tax=Gigaspora rosea TaxID=44941 RepID=A0A397VV77_9GLOM|nr:hypothetical protein C2G38_2240742 [Gigaspora rosea]
MLALLTAKSENEINELFDKIEKSKKWQVNWVSFYRQKWVIASLNKCMSQIDKETWILLPSNTNVAEPAHALSNRRGKNLKLIGHKLDQEKFIAINIHQKYNVSSHGQDKGLVSRNVLSIKRKVITVDSETSSENDDKKSQTINTLEYQERQLVLKEHALALRECEAKIHSIELVNLEKEQKLKSAN